MERLLNGYWWGSIANNSKGIRWLGWGKMARPKSAGGLGFRDLYGFNLALLGKHVWKFCNNHNSLVTRLFKARYFPGDNILNAVKGSNSSFIWAGIWEAKEYLRKGFRWIVGDGEDIKIFKDPWLKGKRDFCVEDSHINGVRNERVCCYFRPNSKDWDVHKVQQDFNSDDIRLILQTRIPQIMARDRVAWTASTTGMYTVKTGYQFWSSQNSSEANIVGGDSSLSWNRIWKLNLPHKLRTFIWRFCNNNIPVRNLLRGKGVATTIICPMCSVDVEHLLHIFFFDCKFAADCWEKMGLWFDMQMVESAPSWLLERFKVESSDIMEKNAIVLSSIWFARNQKIWENKTVTPAIAVEIGIKQVKEWQEAMKRKVAPNSMTIRSDMQCPLIWQPPPAGSYKLNVDASVFKGETSFSIGMVIRDDHGQFLKEKNMRFSGEVTVMEAETRGVQEAIIWIETLNLHGVNIESDSELVVRAIHKQAEYYLEVRHSIEFCRIKLRHRPDCSLSHVKKHLNRVAHLLARVECSIDCFNVFESPPNVLLETLSAEVS